MLTVNKFKLPDGRPGEPRVQRYKRMSGCDRSAVRIDSVEDRGRPWHWAWSGVCRRAGDL